MTDTLQPFAIPPRGWIRPVGNRDKPQIAIVGEAPGEDEERMGIPFVGPSGRLLDSFLSKVGVNRRDCYLTNVFHERPPYNNLEPWTVAKTEANKQWAADGRAGKYPFPPMLKGRYLEVGRLQALDRLRLELETVRPNLVLALGNVACWALLNTGGITKLRGTLARSTLVPGLKVLPTFHPAAVLRMWDLYTIVLMDLMKASRHCHTPEYLVPKRELWLEPTLACLYEFEQKYLSDPDTCIGTDIETQQGQITCIGFAPSPSVGIVVPFWCTKERGKPAYNYWETPEHEVAALRWVRKIVTGPLRKVFQNGKYDMAYLWRAWGMPIGGPIDDTMLMHHALQPELQKGLGFLASIYTDEPEWKSMRRSKADTEKRDE